VKPTPSNARATWPAPTSYRTGSGPSSRTSTRPPSAHATDVASPTRCMTRSRSRFATSQIRRVPSLAALARRWPSGENASPTTGFVWRLSRTWCGVAPDAGTLRCASQAASERATPDDGACTSAPPHAPATSAPRTPTNCCHRIVVVLPARSATTVCRADRRACRRRDGGRIGRRGARNRRRTYRAREARSARAVSLPRPPRRPLRTGRPRPSRVPSWPRGRARRRAARGLRMRRGTRRGGARDEPCLGDIRAAASPQAEPRRCPRNVLHGHRDS